MKKTIQALKSLVNEGLIEDFAIGGGTALLYYTVPFFTEDVDIFIRITQQNGLINLNPLYDHLTRAHNAIREKEYLHINGIPVQFIVPYNALSEEAFRESRAVTIEGEEVKLFRLEYLMAIMVETGKSKYLPRLQQLLEVNDFNGDVLNDILVRHHLLEAWESVMRRLS